MLGLRRAVVWSVALTALLLALCAGALLALVGTDAGSAWLLARVPGLTVTQPQGRLFGGPFAAERVALAVGARRVQLDRLAWADARWRVLPRNGAWFALALDGVRIERADVGPGAASTEPMREPSSLRLPLDLTLDLQRLGQLAFEGKELASDLAAQLELGHERGSVHRVNRFAFVTPRAALRGRAQIATDAPFALDAQASAESAAGVSPRWRASASAVGPLAAIGAKAQLTSADAQGARADAQATVSPFAAWPLSALLASVADLDLAALAENAPRTRLTGNARIDTRGLDAPIAAQLTLANAEPGRWDQQRLPIAALDLELAGRANERQRVAIQRFELRAPGHAGRASGRGEWVRDSATLEIALTALRPAALDARAPAMALDGSLSLRLSGLPAPDGSMPAAATQTLQSTLALGGQLDAKKDAPPVLVRGARKAERSAAAWRAELDGLDVQAGNARLRGNALAQFSGPTLRLATQGAAERFEPSVWWSAAPASLLDGRWQVELNAPASLALPLRDANAWLALRGLARIELQDTSRVAGVALAGSVVADGRQPGWSIDAHLRAANANGAPLRCAPGPGKPNASHCKARPAPTATHRSRSRSKASAWAMAACCSTPCAARSTARWRGTASRSTPARRCDRPRGPTSCSAPRPEVPRPAARA
jgi:translocation and assembly module TamB